VTGTGTGVGKTVTCAALLAAAGRAALSIAMVKPVQTGADHDEPDVDVIRRLAGHADLHEFARLAEPLAPDTAARRIGSGLPTMADVAHRCATLAAARDAVLVEGAGGVLVRLDLAGGTLLTLADALAERGIDASFVVVTGLALGTLNHTELTVRAIALSGHRIDGLIIGDRPAQPGLAEMCNVGDLPRVTGLPVLGSIPHGVGSWPPDRFTETAPSWFSDTDWLAAPSAGS
jgi:dethiobiotin synthetase